MIAVGSAAVSHVVFKVILLRGVFWGLALERMNCSP